jgi:23S rRNA (cytidine1920-2'-O)/16S rRNA (cytidine1409-2'-O)-methyltransferase
VTGKRADVALVERGHFESRAKARAAIEAGLVRADGVVLAKPSEMIGDKATIEASAPHPWVSRAGLKLVAGLDAFGIDPHGLLCLDVGSSTGGFTQVLLSRGADRVIAVDVGRDQLHPSLRIDPRVCSLEATDARRLTPDLLAHHGVAGAPRLVVCDASFISLKLVLPAALALCGPGARLVALIKPQFEAGPSRVRKGIVRDAAVHLEVCESITGWLGQLGWRVDGLIPSPIEGGDGNKEFLVGATLASGRGSA